MDDKEVINNGLVDKFDAEDTIFNNCMNDFDEFPAYITGYGDIEGHFPVKHMDPAFRNLIWIPFASEKIKVLST